MPSSCICPSVCLFVCVCVSVTLRYCVKMAKYRITQIMPHYRPRTSFHIGCFVVAEFLLTSASRSPSAEPLVKMAVVCHLIFKFFNFLVFHQFGRAKMHHHTKFHQNWSNGCRDIAFNVFQNGDRLP